MEKIHRVMGAEVNVTFDCVGFDKTMSTALTATSPGGKVCLVGMGHSEMNVPLTPAAARYYFSFVLPYARFGNLLHEKDLVRTIRIQTEPLATNLRS